MEFARVFQFIALGISLWTLFDIMRSRKRYEKERDARMEHFEKLEREYYEKLAKVKGLEFDLLQQIQEKKEGKKKPDINNKEKLRNILDYVERRN